MANLTFVLRALFQIDQLNRAQLLGHPQDAPTAAKSGPD